MGLSHEHVEPKISAEIYILSRAELLYTLCNEIPCSQMFLKLIPLIFEYEDLENQNITIFGGFV